MSGSDTLTKSLQGAGPVRQGGVRPVWRRTVQTASMVKFQDEHSGGEAGVQAPVLPEQQDVLGVRGDHRDDAAEHPGMGVRRLWCAPRPGRERGESSLCRRAGGSSLRRWCQTAPHVVLGGDRL
jgi:hypothetical protein